MIAQSVFDILDSNNTSFNTPTGHYLFAVAMPYTASLSGSALYDPQHVGEVSLQLRHVTPEQFTEFAGSTYFCRWFGKLPIATYNAAIASSIYDASTASMTFTLVTASISLTIGGYSGTSIHIDWGDGSFDDFTFPDNKGSEFTHTYADDGPWEVNIFDVDDHFYLFQSTSTDQIGSILSISGAYLQAFVVTNSTGITNIPFIAWGNGVDPFATFHISDSALPVSNINDLLVLADDSGLAGSYTFQTNNQSPPAAPTGAGATAASNLSGKGWTVTTD